MSKLSKHLKKGFIPHEENNYEPHFIRHKATLFIFLAIIVVELGLLAQVFLVFDKTKFLAAVLPAVLTDYANREREELGLVLLTPNELLTKAAEEKALDMATKGY